jgi:uncharacterized protein (DUF1330 family)
MAVFMIAQVKVTDDAWLPEYAANVHDIVHRHGGEYLARSANIVPLEGDAPDATVIGILKFPTLAAAQSFVGDVEYAPFARARQAGSVSQFYVIDDTDAAGTLPYLPKG